MGAWECSAGGVTVIMGVKTVLLLLALVSACDLDSDCPLNQTCEDQVCYMIPRLLYQPCSVSAPCSPTYQCVQGRCYHNPLTSNEPCTQTSECVQGFECVVPGQYCSSASR